MTFLAPFALVGVLLLILPIVVHLFKPRKMKQTPFSSLRWLKQTHQRLSRRVQWHQWLLFFMRAGCILLFVLALARPLVGSWGASRATDRFVIVDQSRSMAYQLPELPSALDRAKDLADRLVKSAGPGDRTALVLAGTPPRLLTGLQSDAAPYLPNLRAAQPALSDGTLSGTLPLIRTLLSRQAERDTELVFLTDNLKSRWQQNDVQAFVKDLPGQLKVKVIETGSGSAQNAWIAGARLATFGEKEDRLIRVEVGGVGESTSPRSVRLTGVEGMPDDLQEVVLKPGQMSHLYFNIPAGVNVQGQVAQLRLEPADPLPSDDEYFLNLDAAWALRVLLVEPEAPAQDGRGVGVHLRAGMEALVATKNQSLQVTQRSSASVTASDFQKADVILLAGVPELSDAALEGLEARVRGGAGLAIFFGSQMQPAFYNQKLHKPLQPAEGLLPMPLKSAGKGGFAEGRPSSLAQMRWTHPLLAPLRDPVLSDLHQVRFRVHGALDELPSKTDSILARFDDNVPAIVEHPLGAGRVLVFNISANDDWADLPQRKSFVPLVDQTLSYLSSAGTKRAFTVGDAVDLPLVDAPSGNGAFVVAPSGTKLEPQWIDARGQKVLHLSAVTEAGVYRVEGLGKQNLVFVANASRTDSPLGSMDAESLKAWWSPADLEILGADAASQRLEQREFQWPLWPALIVMAGCLLLAESVYVHHLCPRANPKTADAVVPQRGLMKPIG